MKTTIERDLICNPQVIINQSNLESTPSQKKRVGEKKKKKEKKGNVMKNNDSNLDNQRNASSIRTASNLAETASDSDPKINTVMGPSNSETGIPLEEKKRKKSKRRHNSSNINDNEDDQAPPVDNSLKENSSLPAELSQETPADVRVAPVAAEHHTNTSLVVEGGNLSLTRTRRKKKNLTKGKEDEKRNAVKDNGADRHMIDAKLAGKGDADYNSKDSGLKLTSVEEKPAIPERIDGSPSLSDTILVKQQDVNAKADGILSEMQSPGAEKRKKKRSKMKKVSDSSVNSMETVKDDGVIQIFISESNGQVFRNNDGTSGSDIAGMKLDCWEENSVLAEKIGVADLPSSGTVKQHETDAKAEAILSEIQNPNLKERKKKRAKTKTVSGLSGNSLESVKNDGLIQTLFDHSNGDVYRNNDWRSSSEITGMKMACEVDNVVGRKKRKRSKDRNGRPSADPETAKMEIENKMEARKIEEVVSGISSIKDVSIHHKDEEKITMKEEVTSSLSKSGVTKDRGANKGKSFMIERPFPRDGCHWHNKRKLLVFDLNGILGDVVPGNPPGYIADARLPGRSVFKRPFLDDFLRFCFERFDVGVWSSRKKKNVNRMAQIVIKYLWNKLLFRWNQSNCTKTNLRTQDNAKKPIVLKDLRKLWDHFGHCNSCGKQKYNETNTLLVDDSPYKALLNPPDTAIFPISYQYTDFEDSALGPGGDLRVYLGRLAYADNIQKFVRANPFGQPAISESDPSWEFYSKIIAEAINSSNHRTK